MQLVEVSASEVGFGGVLGGVDLGTQFVVLEHFPASFQESAIVKDCFDFPFKHVRRLAVLLDVVVHCLPSLRFTECLELSVHLRVEWQDRAGPRYPCLEIDSLVGLDAAEQVLGCACQQAQGTLPCCRRIEEEFALLDVAAFEELDELAPLFVAGLDACESVCDAVAEMVWHAVVQGHDWLLAGVKQLLELRGLHALFGVKFERACQELTHFLCDGPSAALVVLWVFAEFGLEPVLLCAVLLPLLELVRLWVTAVQHLDHCHCEREEVVAHALGRVGGLLVKRGRLVEERLFGTGGRVAHQGARQGDGPEVRQLVAVPVVFFDFVKQVAWLDVLVRDPVVVEILECFRELLEECEHVFALPVLHLAEDVGIFLQAAVHPLHDDQN